MKILSLVLSVLMLTSFSFETSASLPPTCDVVESKNVRPVPKGGFVGSSNRLYRISMDPAISRNSPECLTSGDKIAFDSLGRASHHLVCDNNIVRIEEFYLGSPEPQLLSQVPKVDIIDVGMLPVNSVSSSGYVRPNAANYGTGMRAGNALDGDVYNINNNAVQQNTQTNNNVARASANSSSRTGDTVVSVEVPTQPPVTPPGPTDPRPDNDPESPENPRGDNNPETPINPQEPIDDNGGHRVDGDGSTPI